MPENQSKVKATATGKEQGLTGLVFTTAGQVEEELLPALQGRKAIDTYREMRDNDPTVGAILFTIDMLCRQVDWRVDTPDEARDEDAEFLEQCMHDMSQSWGDFVSEVMSMLVFGFSFHEIVYKQRQGPDNDPVSRFNDGKVGWRKLPIRGQESLDRWEFDDTGGIKSYVQKPAPKYEDIIIPIEKGLLFRTSTYKNNPEGRSALRNAYRPWYYKKRIENIEGVGIERDLAGLPLLGVDPAIMSKAASTDDKAILSAIESIGKNIRRDKQEYIIWPNVYDDRGNKVYTFELVASQGSRQFDTDKVIQRYDQRIAMTVLADFILLGHEKVGSFALSSDKTDLFAVALGTYLDVIEDVMNRYAVPRLFELNNMNLESLPEIKHGDIEQPDLASLGQYIGALSGAGVPLFPNEDLVKYLYEAGSFPEPPEELFEQQDIDRQRGFQGLQAAQQAEREQEGAPQERVQRVQQQVFKPRQQQPPNGNGNGRQPEQLQEAQ